VSPQDRAAIGRPLSSARALHPAVRLLRQGIVSFIALTTPVFAVLYWLTIPTGNWTLVVAVHIVICALGALIASGYYAAGIQVSNGGLRERGFFGNVREIPLAQIGSILLLETYRDSALDTQPQLFICAHDGRLLMRMRGTFWSRADMDAVIQSLDVPTEIVDGTLTMAELRRTRPELLYWFERLPQFGIRRARA
jgi:hypothetical protein